MRQDGICISHAGNGFLDYQADHPTIHSCAAMSSAISNTFILMTHTSAKCLDECVSRVSKFVLMGILGMKIRLSTHTHDNWTRGAGLNRDTISSLAKIIG